MQQLSYPPPGPIATMPSAVTIDGPPPPSVPHSMRRQYFEYPPCDATIYSVPSTQNFGTLNSQKAKKSWGQRLKIGKGKEREKDYMQEYRNKFGSVSANSVISKNMKYPADTWRYGSVAMRPSSGTYGTPVRPTTLLYPWDGHGNPVPPHHAVAAVQSPPEHAPFDDSQIVGVITDSTCMCADFLSGTQREGKKSKKCKRCGGTRGTIRGTVRKGRVPKHVRPALQIHYGDPYDIVRPPPAPPPPLPLFYSQNDILEREFNNFDIMPLSSRTRSKSRSPGRMRSQSPRPVRPHSTQAVRTKSPINCQPPEGKRFTRPASASAVENGRGSHQSRRDSWAQLSQANTCGTSSDTDSQNSDSAKRKSILECDVNAYELISKYLKNGPHTLIIPGDESDSVRDLDELSDDLSDNILESSQNSSPRHKLKQSKLKALSTSGQAHVDTAPETRKISVDVPGVTISGQRIRIFNRYGLNHVESDFVSDEDDERRDADAEDSSSGAYPSSSPDCSLSESVPVSLSVEKSIAVVNGNIECSSTILSLTPIPTRPPRRYKTNMKDSIMEEGINSDSGGTPQGTDSGEDSDVTFRACVDSSPELIAKRLFAAELVGIKSILKKPPSNDTNSETESEFYFPTFQEYKQRRKKQVQFRSTHDITVLDDKESEDAAPETDLAPVLESTPTPQKKVEDVEEDDVIDEKFNEFTLIIPSHVKEPLPPSPQQPNAELETTSAVEITKIEQNGNITVQQQQVLERTSFRHSLSEKVISNRGELFNDTMRLRLRASRPDSRDVFPRESSSATVHRRASITASFRMLSPTRPKEPPPPPPLPKSPPPDVPPAPPPPPPRQIFPFTKEEIEVINNGSPPSAAVPSSDNRSWTSPKPQEDAPVSIKSTSLKHSNKGRAPDKPVSRTVVTVSSPTSSLQRPPTLSSTTSISTDRSSVVCSSPSENQVEVTSNSLTRQCTSIKIGGDESSNNIIETRTSVRENTLTISVGGFDQGLTVIGSTARGTVESDYLRTVSVPASVLNLDPVEAVRLNLVPHVCQLARTNNVTHSNCCTPENEQSVSSKLHNAAILNPYPPNNKSLVDKHRLCDNKTESNLTATNSRKKPSDIHIAYDRKPLPDIPATPSSDVPVAYPNRAAKGPKGPSRQSSMLVDEATGDSPPPYPPPPPPLGECEHEKQRKKSKSPNQNSIPKVNEEPLSLSRSKFYISVDNMGDVKDDNSASSEPKNAENQYEVIKEHIYEEIPPLVNRVCDGDSVVESSNNCDDKAQCSDENANEESDRATPDGSPKCCKKSMFEGASKYDILSYLEDAKERGLSLVLEPEYDAVEPDLTPEPEAEPETDEIPENDFDLSTRNHGDRSSHISHVSQASDSSEDNSPAGLSLAKARRSSVEVERNDSGVGSETSKPSRSRWQGTRGPTREDHLCEDCDQLVETQVTDSGVVYAPLVCRKCGKKRAERKEIIAEIVETEAKYGRDLRIIMEEFFKPMLVAGLLTHEQLSAIFLNVEELIEINIAFVEKLKDALEIAVEQGDEDLMTVNVGRLFLDTSPMLHAFESYCTRQGAASLLLANLEKEKELLRIFLRVSQMENAVLRRMNLNSFLMVPVQRVTKYPLLLSRLYKVTPPHHEGREILKQAQQKIELHLEHMNAEAKDISTTKLWRRISMINVPYKRTNSETDIVNIKLRKMALDLLDWNHDEVRFAMEGRLLFTQITDNNWRRGRTVKLNPINALLVTFGKPTADYQPEAPENLLLFPKKTTGIREATLLLVRDKNGRYSLLRDPLCLDKCIVCWESEWDDCFEVQEFTTKDTYMLKAEDIQRTRTWFRQLQYHSQGLGTWRRRRNALANIMMNGMARS